MSSYTQVSFVITRSSVMF